MIYSLNGMHVVTGSVDKMIRIWDAESGIVVGEPLMGHNGQVLSVAHPLATAPFESGMPRLVLHSANLSTGILIG